MVRFWPAMASGLLAFTLSACGTAPSATSSSLANARTPLPAGRQPSQIAKMVCDAEAQQKFAASLGVTATVKPPTWENHLYSCVFAYPGGSFTLSVKELSSWAETLAYFNGLAAKMGRTQVLRKLGQGAFQTRNGSVVVRKDWKVLLVDVSHLPAQFGKPLTPSGYDADTVAFIVLGCWDGD